MPKLSAASRGRLAAAHPLLQQLFSAIAEEAPILVLDSQRGRVAQERAFSLGNSRAHFGQSAHNWAPAIALDVAPAPLDWNDAARYLALARIVKAKAKELGIPIAWGGDWQSIRDLPHYELAPWRAFAAKASPFLG